MKTDFKLEVELGLNGDRLLVKATQSKRSKKIRYHFQVLTFMPNSIVINLTDSAKVDIYLYLLKGWQYHLGNINNNREKEIDIMQYFININNSYTKILEIFKEEPCIKNLSEDFVEFWSNYIYDKHFDLADLINFRTLGYQYGDYFFYDLYPENNVRYIGAKNKEEINNYLQLNYEDASSYLTSLGSFKDFKDGFIKGDDIKDYLVQDEQEQNYVLDMIYRKYLAILSGIVFNYKINSLTDLTDLNTPIEDLDFKNVKFNSNILLKNKVNEVSQHISVAVEENKVSVVSTLTDKDILVALYTITITDSIDIWVSSSFPDNLRNVINDKLIINPTIACNIICRIYDSYFSRHKKKSLSSTTSNHFTQPVISQEVQSCLTEEPITITVKRNDLVIEDMNLTEFKETLGTKHLQHKSPVPHYRSEHTRIYKNGRISKVKGTIINKDKLKNTDFVNYNIKYNS